MDAALLAELNRQRAARHAVIVETDLATGRARLHRRDAPPYGPLGEALAAGFASGRSAQVEIEGRQVFLNVHNPPVRLVVIGAVHISQALAPMARIAGFDVEIIDPRTAFATPDRFRDADLHGEWPEAVLAGRPLDAFSALIAVTHDPKIDDLPIVEALKAEAFYVGALGSRKTHSKRVERLRAQGLSEEWIARIRAPIGLPIGAASPAEIAVAILAEVVEALRLRKAAGRES